MLLPSESHTLQGERTLLPGICPVPSSNILRDLEKLSWEHRLPVVSPRRRAEVRKGRVACYTLPCLTLARS